MTGRILSVLRGLQGLTQRQLAERAGLNKTAISDYETRRREIPEGRRRRLLAALGLPLRAWDDTVRHVEWLEHLTSAHAEPLDREALRVAESVARDFEVGVTALLRLLLVLSGRGEGR